MASFTICKNNGSFVTFKILELTNIVDKTYVLFQSFAAKSSKSFDHFLSLLGDRVKLKGFDKYKGGLDNKSMSNSDFLFVEFNFTANTVRLN